MEHTYTHTNAHAHTHTVSSSYFLTHTNMLKKHKSMHREAPQWKPSARGEMGAIEKSSGFSKALKNKFLHSELVGSI